MLTINNLVTINPGFTLGPISFALENGISLAIIGPNGSGKSTFMKSFLGIYQVHSGQIFVDNKETSQLSEKERSFLFSYVPQKSSFHFQITIEEMIRLGLYPHQKKISVSEQTTRIQCLAKQFQLINLLNRDVNEVSLGELQRAIICRALIQQSKIVCFDEPDIYLDIGQKVKMFSLVLDYAQEKQMTSIWILHDIVCALRYCKKILVLHHGKVCFFGNSEEISSKIIEEVFEFSDLPIKNSHLERI